VDGVLGLGAITEDDACQPVAVVEVDLGQGLEALGAGIGARLGGWALHTVSHERRSGGLQPSADVVHDHLTIALGRNVPA
jgi:hypothetical protein